MASLLGWMSPDGKMLLVTKFFRTLAFGYLSTALPYYFGNILSFSDFLTGIIAAVALIGGVVLTITASLIANKVSRRNSLSLFAFLMLISGALLIASADVIIILIAVFIGSIGVNATETGPFISIEQAIMPQTTTDDRRTYAFSIFNLLGYAGAAFGALLGALPELARNYLNFTLISGYRALFALFALTGLLLMVVYRSLSHRAEVEVARISRFGLDKSARTVTKLSVLFSIDAFGGGFVISLIISLWFKQRYNASVSEVGAILFVTQIVTAASFLVAGLLARRIGLLRTMVFTHIPSNILLIAVGLAPTFGTSVAFLLLRQSISQMDVPTRQSYMTAIIPSEERNAANSITNVSRSIAAAPPPTISGYLIQSGLWAAPFLFGGVFKIAYDILIYLSFRNVKPPEEKNKE